MAKTLRILFLGLAIVLSGSTMAQNKSADRNARHDKVMKLRKGGFKHAKKAKKAPLFTKTTTIFSEDFTNGLDTTWRIYDYDGDGYNWEYDSYNECMTSWSYDEYNWEALTPDNWLITPQITIPANGAVLSYGYFAYDEDFYEEVYSVMVSPSGSDDIDSFYVAILSDDMLTTDAYTTNILPLNLFAGRTVRVAFVHHNCSDEWALGLDDIEVYSLDSIDLAVTATNVINVSVSNPSATITADVQNIGFTAINNLTVYCDVNGTVTNTTIATLPSLQTATASFTGVDFSNVGTYNIKFYVAVTNDADNTNDTLSVTTSILPAFSLTWDFEGDTNLPVGFTTGRYDNGTAYSYDLFPNNEAWTVHDISQYIANGYYALQGLDGGSNVAMAQDWFDENDTKTPYPSNRWLITPKVRLTTGNYFVWDAISYEDPYLETYRVRISTTNTDTASFTTLTTIFDESGDAWQRHAIDLSAYAGQDVYFAIQLISDDMNMLWIDNIKIAGSATIATDEPEGLATADNDVRIYPNPASDNIHINANSQITLVELIDMTGRVVMAQDGDVKSLNVSALAEGIYTLRVVSENGVSLKRVVKK